MSYNQSSDDKFNSLLQLLGESQDSQEFLMFLIK